MSLRTLIAVSVPNWTIAETLIRVHAALSSCQSVEGLCSVQRCSSAPYTNLQRHSILSAPTDEFIGEAALAAAVTDINESTEGLEARWEVVRFGYGKSGIETWSYFLELFYEPTERKSSLSGLKDVFFIDAGSQRNFLREKRLRRKKAAEAAALNLELLADEMCAIAAIPVKRPLGIPVHNLDTDHPGPLSSTWLLFDERSHEHNDRNLGVRTTTAGPLYYSPDGPLGDLQSVQLEGKLL